MTRAETIAKTTIEREDGTSIVVLTLHHVAYTGADSPLYSTSVSGCIGGNPDIISDHSADDARRTHANLVAAAYLMIGAGVNI
jgi:hypothetical protein